jgi:phage shock protein C
MLNGKKLYRDKVNGKISGVCAGLAEYFEIDVTLIRLIWAIIILFSFGMGIFLYFIFAIIMPLKTN